MRIIIFERLLGSLNRWLRKMFIKDGVTNVRFIENIDTFLEKEPKGYVLLVLKPLAWIRAKTNYPNIAMFNIDGLVYEMVKAFNRIGYLVDIVDYTISNFIPPKKNYKIVVVHGGNCKIIIDHLPADIIVIHYASGAYWKSFNDMSMERYKNYSLRKHTAIPSRFERSLAGTETGEEYLAKRANYSFVSGPRTLETFRGISKNMHLLYLGAYIDYDLRNISKDYEAGRKNFIYVAGTGGNIQKGMDLLIEAFMRLPNLNLYIYCNIEDDILYSYKKELSAQNIRYIYHLRLPVFRKKLISILSEINFTISAPINTGPGTAFIGSMGLGLIPVGYVDIEGESDDSCLTEEYSIESLVGIIMEASKKNKEWCQNASQLNIQKYEMLHNPESFGKNFTSYLNSLPI